jgi:multiple sugar transport system permease protein
MKNTKLRLADILMVFPSFIIYLIFMVVPIFICMFYSITNWNGIRSSFRIIGLENFIDLLSDDTFLTALKVTFLVTIITTIIYITLGIILAVFLDKPGKIYNFCKCAFFLPTVLSTVVVSFIWSYMTQGDGGIINTVLGIFKIPGVDFYSSKLTTLYTISGVMIWAWLGFFTTIFISTLKTIPEELYEASVIDGAGPLAKFFHITLPLLTPGITINTILCITGGLKQYDYFKIMIAGSQETITVNAVSRAVDYNMFSYASAIVVVLFAMMAILSLAQLKLMKRFEVEY